MKRRLISSTLSLAVVQLANYIAPFIILVHLTKTLGLELYGVLAFTQGIILLSLVFIDFGYSLSATSKISKNRSKKKYINHIIGGIFIVKLFLLLLCCAVIFIYSVVTEKYAEHKIIFLLSTFPIAMQGFSPVWLFHGIEKMGYYATAIISAKVFFASTVILFVKLPSDVYLVPVLNGLGQFLALFIAILLIYRLGYEIKIPRFKFIAYCFNFTRHFFASRVAVASYMNGSIIVLGLIAQPATVAIYSMAEQLYKVMQNAFGPVAVASYPYMTREKDISLMFKLIIGVVILAVCVGGLGYYLAPTLVKLVFDETWLASIPVLNVFFIAIVIHAAAIMTGYPLAAVVGRLEVANSSVITGAVVYFLLLGLAVFSNLVTPVSIAAVMVISELTVLLHRSIVLLPLAANLRSAARLRV